MCLITDKSMSHNLNNLPQHAFDLYIYLFFSPLWNDVDTAGDSFLLSSSVEPFSCIYLFI